MKDSGIEWIDKIPSNWAVLRNKYNFDLNKNIVGAAYKDTQLLSLTKNGVKEITEDDQKGKVPTSFATYQTVDKDDIIMCLFDLDVSAVFSGISPYEGMISPAYKCFKCKEHLFPQYIDYYFRTVFVDRKYKRYSKNVRYSIGTDEFMALPITVPPLEVQKSIANFLDQKCTEIDSIFADIQSQINVLEEYKKSIITEAVTKGLNPDVEMKNSGVGFIGDIPMSWSVLRMKNIGSYRNGLTYSPSDLCDETEGTIVLRSSNIQNGKLAFEDNAYVSATIPKQLFVNENDILICSRNGSQKLVGKSAIIPKNINASFGAFMMIFRCNNKALPKYAYYLLNSGVFSYYLASFFTSTINQLTGQNFGNMKVPFCHNIEEQKSIIEYLDQKCTEIEAVIIDKKTQLQTLAEYKKSLIYEYVTGKKEIVS